VKTTEELKHGAAHLATTGASQATTRTPAYAERFLPKPAPGPVTNFWRIVAKASHSLLVIAMASAAIYLMYCAVTGRRDALMVWALVMIGVEAVVYATFGKRCPLTILARNLGDEGGHDYLFEWILGTSRIKYVARTLALLSVIGVLALIISELVR
jgi:hypothetical protein